MTSRCGEFDLIERIRRRVATRDDVALGIGDDAALLEVPPGKQLVVATDTLNAGIHFPVGTPPADIGWKALAVNLSDLAAMGARPAWCTLALSLPESDAAWLDGLVDGFHALASMHSVALVGGDTTRGPLSVSMTAMGLVSPGRALRRDGACLGDDIWVSGTLGDAAAALSLLGLGLAPPPHDVDRDVLTALRSRLDRPTPRLDLGEKLAGLASACIDLSDGLLADLGHVARASGVGAQVDLDLLPSSPELARTYGASARALLQATGGDDYELLFCAPAAAREALQCVSIEGPARLTRIGRIVAGEGVAASLLGADWQPPRRGFDHFAGG